jgi:riboflavin kinase/FMN adenylyltransferase
MMEYTTTLAGHEPIVITIGNFDGIHRGHQFLLQELHTMARHLESTPVLVTFSPHTLAVVRPDIQIQYLTTLEEKLALAKQYTDTPNSIVIHFTPEVAAMTAGDFMDTLTRLFTVKGLTVGANFSLGHNRQGNVSFLEQYGREHAIQLKTIALEENEHVRISSTRIRTLIGDGNIAEGNALLGHPLTLSGPVQHGDKRGRQIGFPTANLRPDPHKLLPANGVYAARVRVHGSAEQGADADAVYNSVVNIGVRPTFNGTERLVEAHLLDVDLDLYEKHLTIEFIARLRSEQRFSGIEALKSQIISDVQRARQILYH